MRDPKRIPRIMDLLQTEWEKHPDLRFGQLIYNLLDGIWDTTEVWFFLLEDDLMEQRLLGETIGVE